jgi:hypothetical protein
MGNARNRVIHKILVESLKVGDLLKDPGKSRNMILKRAI